MSRLARENFQPFVDCWEVSLKQQFSMRMVAVRDKWHGRKLHRTALVGARDGSLLHLWTVGPKASHPQPGLLPLGRRLPLFQDAVDVVVDDDPVNPLSPFPFHVGRPNPPRCN